MRNRWKILVVVALAIALAAILAGKRNGANTAPRSSSSASRRTAPQPPAASPQAPVPAPAEVAENPLPAPASFAPAKPTAKLKPARNAERKALPQMIELGSKTCIPCQKMQPILAELRKEYAGQLEVPFWDVYEHPDKVKAYGIRVIPTQVFIGSDGREFFRHEGFFPKDDIIAKFREHGVNLSAAARPKQASQG